MSEPRRLPMVAIGAAVLALVFALVAVIVVIKRGEPEAAAKTPATAHVAPISDYTVKAADVLQLKSERTEVVVEAGVTKGLRLTSPELAKRLGLEDGDVMTAVAGRRLDREYATSDMVFKLTMLDPTIIYVDVDRKGESTVLRWKLDGGLREERDKVYASMPSLGGITGGTGSGSIYSSPDLPASVLATIEKVDDNNYKLPRATVDKILANPMSAAKGARVVPSVKNGAADGFKIYAVRPGSVYDRLGFANGDTIQAINGYPLTSADKALEVYTKLRTVDSISVDITRRGKPITLGIRITK